MSEETVIESAAAAEVQEAAEKSGWIPPSRYKGDAEHFIDADEFIRRGETILPIVKKQLSDTRLELASVRAAADANAKALKAAQDAIEDIQERHSAETQRAVAEARKELKVQLAAASEGGDHAAVAELTDQLTQLGKAEEKAEKKEAKVETLPVFVPPTEMVEWQADNPWFTVNKRKTALALAIAQELREGGETLKGRPFFDKVAAEVEKELGGGKTESRESKVESGRNGTGDDTRGGGKATYASMPAEARAACDADAKGRVGEGKRYKTLADWRSRYAAIYHQER